MDTMDDTMDDTIHDANVNDANVNEANANEANVHEANVNEANVNEANVNEANVNDAKTVPEYLVHIKDQYIMRRSTNNNTNPNTSTNESKQSSSSSSSSSTTTVGKKRLRDDKPTKDNRLCRSKNQGEVCLLGDQCVYTHDVAGYLASKPADLGPVCYQFNTFGFCHNGFMCRYGDSHINRVDCTIIKRSDENGGVIERESINVLSKDVQNSLRKKNYDFKKKGTAPSDETTNGNTKNDRQHASYPSKTIKLVDFSNKVYVAPLTTVGNLPFRRVLRDFGADITCGEMAMTYNLLQGQASEWALLRRHPSEDLFGIQLAGNQPDIMAKMAQIIENEVSSSFVDLNCGCPIDIVTNRGCGSALMTKPSKLCDIIASMTKYLTRPVTVKIRTGWACNEPTAHKLIPKLQQIAKGRISAIMIHGRSRQQRYTKSANWDYILEAAKSQSPELPRIPIIGNGDIFSIEDWQNHQKLMEINRGDSDYGLCNCAMIGRGALIKPWLPQEIKENRHIDISASERLDMLKTFCNYGLEHWGSDQQGINTVRRFLLEWLSFLCRYVPSGLVERTQKMQQRPPQYFGRCDMETLMASTNPQDWVRLSELLLGPVPTDFHFEPKHKSNGYSEADISNG